MSTQASYRSRFFVLRTPLLAFDELLAWNEGLSASQAESGSDAVLQEAMASDVRLLRGRLRGWLLRPEVREALFVAAPSLLPGIEAWLEDPDSPHGHKVERPLVRYLSRMTSRATPFGIFSGISVGTVGTRTRLRMAPREEARRHVRLDADYLQKLSDALSERLGLHETALFRPNSSLYTCAGMVRYALGRRHSDTGLRTFELMGLPSSEYLQAVLHRAAQGQGATLALLASCLRQAAPEVTDEESLQFVTSLVSHQLLVSDVEPPHTGLDGLDALLERLAREPTPAEPVRARLRQVRELQHEVSQSPLGAARYEKLIGALEQLLPKSRDLASYCFQVDLSKPLRESTLSQQVCDDVLQGVHILQSLSWAEADRRDEFRRRFVERYQDREVPLVEALDEESGLGFSRLSETSAEALPVLQGIFHEQASSGDSNSFGPVERWLLRRLARALAERTREISIDPAEVEQIHQQLKGKQHPLPDSLSSFVMVAAASPQALEEGRYRVHLTGVSGPPGMRLLGRFCYMDEKLQQLVDEDVRAEEALRPEAVFAEVVHVPGTHDGNFSHRPVLRDYEIPYVGRSGAPPEQQLPITDLRLSVVGGRLVLRSERLGREVVPRVTTAQNFAHMQGPARFLFALQGIGQAERLEWRWGALEAAPFLPRVVCGRIVLSLARWRLEPQVQRALMAAHGPERFRAVQRLRRELDLPRHVVLTGLVVDLDNVLSVGSFVGLLKGEQPVSLLELFPAPEEMAVQGPEGCYAHEFVIPFVREPALEERPALPPARRVAPTGVRSFAPGSEWLYAKLYMGTVMSDHALAALEPLISEALGTGMANLWFFIRYQDPEAHLRVRFHGPPARLWGELLPRLEQATSGLRGKGALWRMQLDTYEREVERYGGDEGIVLSEALFDADSQAALGMLAVLRDEGLEDQRWRAAIWGMDALLNDLGLELEHKRRLLTQQRDAFAREHAVEADMRHRIGQKYRAERLVLLETPAAQGWPERISQVLRQRSERLRPLGERLRALEAQGRLTIPVQRLAASYLHMHANRVLHSTHRAQETVLYDFMVRLYSSQLARGGR
ncbi:lantibiotic dehydratase [Stigmatella sp. ncwal1]|uniref:Lantibiotic dehydratase n=1 Tax=Stigmatella ashevillensis TaxID=2995309 RepID=A0ABT5D3K4_9BACT|nr:lantibiotic dehydratase [Stigmatella ashevillena]MDC0708255.1 lantibiotic dehydratase [Stigmatella ashevillena]